jgi:hypothetical protein
LAELGKKIVILSSEDQQNIFPHKNITFLPFSFDLFFSLLPHTGAVFSAMIDFHHLISLTKFPIYNFCYQTRKFYNLSSRYSSFARKYVINPTEVISVLENNEN